MKDEFGKYYEATEPGRRERAYAWATAIGLQDGVQLGVEKRHVERIVAALKKKAGLKRRGARKNGEWYFEEP